MEERREWGNEENGGTKRMEERREWRNEENGGTKRMEERREWRNEENGGTKRDVRKIQVIFSCFNNLIKQT